MPVIRTLGVDPVHFGMVMMINLGIGLITPPVGSVLFVGSAVANLTIEQVTRAMLPFYLGLLAVLMAITYLPEISLWLPRLAGLH
jgi:TRAP-type C4-dicarboxylate transport system permease large subunit